MCALLCSTAAIASAQEPAAAAPTAAPVALTDADRAQYVGVFEADTPDGAMSIQIYQADGRLMGRPEHEDEPSPLTPLGNHRFRPDLLEEAVITFTVENGRATKFAIAFPDERGTLIAIRKP